MVEFDVKLFKNDNVDIQNKSKHYKAYWKDGCYYANNLRVEIKAASGDISYVSSWTTLESVIHEAENHLLDEKFGCATIYDGKYRVATVSKTYRDQFISSNLTKYGKTCAKSER